MEDVKAFYEVTSSEMVVVLGGAGIDTEADVQKLKDVTSHLNISIEFVNDADVALISSSGAGVLISGTGSIALGYEKGNRFRVGGWGQLVGDEGSGYAIARDALTLCTQMLDGRLEQTDILKSVLQHLNLKEHQLSDYINAPITTKDMIAALTPIVLSHRLEPSIKRVIEKCIDDLYNHLKVLDEKLNEDEGITLMGGIMTQTTLGSELIQYAREKGVFRPIAISNISPVEGALMMAKKGGFI